MRETVLSRWEGSLWGSRLGEENQTPVWLEKQTEGIIALATTAKWEVAFTSETTPSEMLLQSLPLLLFFCDQLSDLKRQLWELGKQRNYSVATQTAMISYATVMSWALTEQLNGNTVFKRLGETVTEENSYEILQILQTNLQQGKTLQETKGDISSPCQEIWLALYCFASTSEDVVLSVCRGKKCFSNPVILGLVGALSGGHNGVRAIPIFWRSRLKKEEREQGKQMLESMFVTWSGSYEFAKINQLRNSIETRIIAPSGVIQPR